MVVILLVVSGCVVVESVAFSFVGDDVCVVDDAVDDGGGDCWVAKALSPCGEGEV